MALRCKHSHLQPSYISAIIISPNQVESDQVLLEQDVQL